MMVWKIYILLYKYGHICYLCYISFWGASSQTEALKFYPTCFWLGTPPQKIPNEYPFKVDQQKTTSTSTCRSSDQNPTQKFSVSFPNVWKIRCRLFWVPNKSWTWSTPFPCRKKDIFGPWKSNSRPLKKGNFTIRWLFLFRFGHLFIIPKLGFLLCLNRWL